MNTGNTGNTSQAWRPAPQKVQASLMRTGTVALAMLISYASVLRPLLAQRAGHPVLAALEAMEAEQEVAVMTHEMASISATQVARRLKVKLPLNNVYYHATGQTLIGEASWYGPGFHGRRAADGSRYDMNAMTAAHKSLPFGTVVRVTNKRTGQSCLVRITDRGPYIDGRIIDLSKAAAKSIGMLGSGVAPVKVEVLAPRETQVASGLHEDNLES